MRPTKIFAIGAFCALVLSGGCGQPVGTATDEVVEPGAAEASPASRLSEERWQIVQLPERHLHIAGISGAAGRGAMQVSCETQSDTLTASLILQEHLSGDPSRRSVDLLFDEGGFTSPIWTPRTEVASTPSAFDIVHDKNYYAYADPFWHHIENLKKHDVVVAVVKEGRTEVSRYEFSLAGVRSAIDAVVGRCSKPRWL